MKHFWTTRISLVVFFIFGANPCFAAGTFTVTNHSVGDFAGWATAASAKPLVGDFNGDGKTDVALTGGAGWWTLPVAFSKGNGMFTITNEPIADFAAWAATPGAKPLAGDFNGDGKTDLALTGVTGWWTLPVAFSNGNGRFTVTNQSIGDFAAWAATASAKPLVGDFNGDEKADVALTGVAGWWTLPVAFSKGNGVFGVTNAAVENFAGWAATANAKPLVGDFDGDRKDDVALTGAAGWGSIPVALSIGDGTFDINNPPVGDFGGWAATAKARPLIGDLNGDRRADIALTGPAGWGSLPVAFSSGNGITNEAVENFAGWAATANAHPLVGDFDGDGKTDVALTGPAGWGSLPVAFSKGDGTFTITNEAIAHFAGWAAAPGAQPLVGDFNGDGKNDVALTGVAGWWTLPVAFSQ